LLPSASDTESALLQRVERIETRLDMSIPAGEAAPLAPKQYVRKTKAAEPPKAESAPANAAPPEPSPPLEPPPAAAAVVVGEPTAAAVRTMWPTVREKVRQRSRTTEVMLAGATVGAVEGDTLVLSHESAPLAKRLSEPRNAEVIREALKDALGVDCAIRCVAGSAAAPPTPAPAEPTVEQAQRAHDAEEEERMLAEASNDHSEAPRRDPEEAALELLQNELGARRID
jgi:DNA polymerase III subunit gamma/tau